MTISNTSDLKNVVFDPQKTFIRIPLDNINIEFLTSIPGKINFSDALRSAEDIGIDEVSFKVMGYEHLLVNKRATNRPKDLNDIIELERRRS